MQVNNLEVEDVMKKGKTKNVYRLNNGNILLAFKDDATGTDGVFDPGANQVGLQIEGKGRAGVRLTEYFFKKIKEKGISPTHFVRANVEKATVEVKRAVMFGEGLEFVCRIYADGSFVRRYGKYVNKGDFLDYLVEITLKDDDRDDPLANEMTLVRLGLLNPGEYAILENLTREVTKLVAWELGRKGLILWDIKFEFARDPKTGDIMLVDDISTDCWRVKEEDGSSIDPLEVARRFFADGE